MARSQNSVWLAVPGLQATFTTKSAQSVISLPRGNPVAFGLMRTLSWIFYEYTA